MADYECIEAYQSLRGACYEAAQKDGGALLGESDRWLRTAFSNAGAEGIFLMTRTENGILCNASCWTSQTGGSTEFIDFTVPFAALEGT